MTLEDLDRLESVDDITGYDACATRINLQEPPAKHVKLVVNEYGKVEYRVINRDGHLGALRD